MSVQLSHLAADPGRIDGLEPEGLPALIGEAEALKARLWARLQAAGTPRAPSPASRATDEPDGLLTAKEAAGRLGVSVRWMYRKASGLPFTRRLSGGTLRFSERGLLRWREGRR